MYRSESPVRSKSLGALMLCRYSNFLFSGRYRVPTQPERTAEIIPMCRKYLNFLLKLSVMISKARIKFIKSLQVKKYRKQEQCFIVEGAKSVKELLRSDFQTLWVAGTEDFTSNNKTLLAASGVEVVIAN